MSLDDEHVANSPYDIRVDPGPYGDTSGIEQFTFVVCAKDRNGEPLKTSFLSRFKVKVDGPAEVEADVQDIGDSRYVVSYKLPEPGRYSISCKIGLREIQGSPFISEY